MSSSRRTWKVTPEDVVPKIREYVNEIAKEVPKPPEGAINFLTPEEMEDEPNIVTTTDDSEAVEDADMIISWLPKGGVQPKIFEDIIDDIPEGLHRRQHGHDSCQAVL